MLDYSYAFIERLGQRYESFEPTDATALSYVKVVYTTAPAQTPEGDISENGSFNPATQVAWVHDDSPLLKLLTIGLKRRLQVKLGLVDDRIHEVEVVSHLGSAARPVWICVQQSYSDCSAEEACTNTPTIGLPSKETLTEIPLSLTWQGKGFFNEGVWRFQINASATTELKIDGKPPCCDSECQPCCCCKPNTTDNNTHKTLEHIYLKGMHTIELKFCGYRHSQPFELLIYRIR